ncbi:hypothetical protein H0264_19180 [Nocardia huaxiensis]|uniref:Uncharacterized protein n=1 Tax=Nocardia huaxiensis TaxID=2755382 RepID=A0A7D6ZGQ8_9NOCA|nr:hypothetical protein H0264_19180 [Nocardia huaxiensis]
MHGWGGAESDRSRILVGLSWVVAFVPLLSFGFLTPLYFLVLAIRARSGKLALAALGYLSAAVVALLSIARRDLVFDIAWCVLMLGGTWHALATRRLWLRPAWRRPAVVAPVDEWEPPAAAAPTPVPSTPILPSTADPFQRLIDEIDLLVDERMAGGEFTARYHHTDPDFPDCPNPYCDEPWHGLAITMRMQEMRYEGEVDPEYYYEHDDSPVICPGSLHGEGWEPPSKELLAEWWAANSPYAATTASPVPDNEPPPKDPRLEQADAFWAAVARPAVMVGLMCLILAVASMFLAPAQWRWLTPITGVVPVWTVMWLFGPKRRALPPGYLRDRLRARPETIFALVLMLHAGWMPLAWVWRTPIDTVEDVSAGYHRLLAACAVAGVGFAIVQLSRIQRVPAELVDGVAETDRADHALNMFAYGILWLIIVLPAALLFGWTLGRFTHQSQAMWAMVGVLMVLVLTYLAVSLALSLILRDLGIFVIAVVPGAVVTALLWWSVTRLEPGLVHL